MSAEAFHVDDLEAIEQLARIDPDVDWPRPGIRLPTALGQAFERSRHRQQVVLGHVERGLQHVRNGLAILGPQLPTSTSKPARAERELNAGTAALKSALVHAGRMPAGALLVDERPHVPDRADAAAPTTAELALEARVLVDRARLAAGRVALNMDHDEAGAVLAAIESELARAGDGHLGLELLERVRERLAPRVARARQAAREAAA